MSTHSIGIVDEPSAPTVPIDRPNILLIIADDFGIDTSPCYDVGVDKPEMPTLESLCDEGLVFETVWVNPQCTPTRATILTGQYGFRTGVVEVFDELEDTRSIQDLLADQDAYSYPNAVVGKWHLGGELPDSDHPKTLGVQHYAGFLSGAVNDYSNWTAIEGDSANLTITEYATTWMTDKAIEWIGGQSGQPWFLWVAYNAPHWPYHVPPPHLHRRHGLTGEPVDVAVNPRGYYLAMAEALDTEMGRLLDSMPPAVRENTTILFVGDNGTDQDVVAPPFDPTHAKETVYEGGVRVPLVVAGHGVTRRGEREDSLINGTDLFATVARLGGHPDTTINDGISFDQALTDPDFVGRTHVFTEFPGVWAVRDERYKLIEKASGERRLFDLENDPFETEDLLASSPMPEVEAIADGLAAYQQELESAP